MGEKACLKGQRWKISGCLYSIMNLFIFLDHESLRASDDVAKIVWGSVMLVNALGVRVETGIPHL